MKNDPLTGILTVVLVAATLGTAAMCYKYLMVSRDSHGLQEVVVRVNQRKALANQLSMDLGEYSSKHPEIKPVLDQLAMQLQTLPAPTNPVQP